MEQLLPRALLGKCLLVQVSSLPGFSNIRLSLTELSQIKSCNFFSLFDLLFVGSDFCLQIVNQRLHSFTIFAVFVGSKCQFLDPAFRSSQILLSISQTSIFSIHFRL